MLKSERDRMSVEETLNVLANAQLHHSAGLVVVPLGHLLPQVEDDNTNEQLAVDTRYVMKNSQRGLLVGPEADVHGKSRHTRCSPYC